MDFLTWIEKHQALAAWLQGVGALALIGFSVWQSHHVDRGRRAERDRERRAFLDLAEEMTRRTFREFSILYANWDAKTYAGLAAWAPSVQRKGCDRFRHLAAIPLERWPSVYLFTACQELLARMERTVEMAAMFGLPEDPAPLGLSRMDWMRTYLEELRAKSHDVERHIGDLLTSDG